MQPLAVAQAGLDGMAEGVAEVEDGAQPAFAFVLAHHPRLDLAAAAHGMGQRIGVARQQIVEVGFDPGEELDVGDRPVLDDLGQPGAQLAQRQRAQRVQVADHALRLVERADHVLADRVVDGGLAAHRRIHLRQQRGRHLHERHAAHVARGGKAGHVADHPAAQREEHGLAVAAVAEQAVEDQVERGPVLELLAVGQLQHRHRAVVRGQRALQPRCIQRRHGGVADDQRLRGARQALPGGRRVEQAAADEDVVALRAGVHRHHERRSGCAGRHGRRVYGRPCRPSAAGTWRAGVDG